MQWDHKACWGGVLKLICHAIKGLTAASRVQLLSLGLGWLTIVSLFKCVLENVVPVTLQSTKINCVVAHNMHFLLDFLLKSFMNHNSLCCLISEQSSKHLSLMHYLPLSMLAKQIQLWICSLAKHEQGLKLKKWNNVLFIKPTLP